jgi:hypothetical protein
MHADVHEESAQAAASLIAQRTAGGAQRRAQLEGAAEGAGVDWANRLIRELISDQRDIVGGWPGTLREARTAMLESLERSLPASFAISHDEQLQVIRVGYAAARRTWLAQRAGREPTEARAVDG